MGVLRQKKVKEEGTGGRRWGNASESKTAKQVSKGRAALMAEGACMPAMPRKVPYYCKVCVVCNVPTYRMSSLSTSFWTSEGGMNEEAGRG